MTSAEALVASWYSTSVVDSETTFCFLEDQNKGLEMKQNT